MRTVLWVLMLSSQCVLGGAAQTTSDRINFGREWKTWTPDVRAIYVDGFMAGQSDTYLAVFNDLPMERREPLRKATFLLFSVEAISDVMTDLYKDPANTFIRYGAMVYIARDKLSGADVEPMLRRSREFDFATPRKR